MTSCGKLVLIIGPSGVGKSAVLRTLKRHHPELVFPRSATTRPRRPVESDELYHFVSDEVFDRWMGEGKFLEWAQVHQSARYGTLRDEILPAIDAGKIVVREVDVQGFRSVAALPEFSGESAPYRLQTIFILPEDERQLVAHIRKRSAVSDVELDRRLKSMREEMTFAPRTDVQIINREGRLKETIVAVEQEILGDHLKK